MTRKSFASLCALTTPCIAPTAVLEHVHTQAWSGLEPVLRCDLAGATLKKRRTWSASSLLEKKMQLMTRVFTSRYGEDQLRSWLK